MFILILLFLLSLAFSYDPKLSPDLRRILHEGGGLSTKAIGLEEVKVLYRDGRVEVVDVGEGDLLNLLSREDVVYIEAPRELKPLTDVVRVSSIGVHGSGNLTLSLRTRDGQSLSIRGFRISGVNLSGSCTGSPTSLRCSSGSLDINVSSSGDFRLIISSENEEVRVSDLSGATAYYLGTSASLSGKTGRGVIIAVVDTGINPCHPAFLKGDGSTRILFFYEPKSDKELDSAQINSEIQNGRCHYDSNGHGTHVAGIAAGGDPNTPYKGIAPQAELIIVKLVDFTDTEIIKALDYLIEKRQSLNKPIVVNMSIGGHFGPHDGTGLLSRAVDNAVNSGLFVIVAAGNEGNRPIHAQMNNLTSEETVNLETLTPGGDQINGWYRGGSLSVSFCKGTSCISAPSGAVASGSLGSCSVYIDNSVTSSPLNGDGEFLIAYDCSGSFSVKLDPGSGTVSRIDMYFVCPFCYSEFKDHVPYGPYGGVLGTVGVPGVAKKAITVGAITSKPILGTSEINTRSFADLGKIAFFSSRGPTRDGRTKPDVVAGGLFVYSASNDGRSYVPQAGTSMATPVVSGIVALMLEGSQETASYYTSKQIKDSLVLNAIADQSTGQVPNNIYGYGKVYLGKSGVDEDQGGSPSKTSGGGGGCSVSGSGLSNGIILITALLLYKRIRRRAHGKA